MRCRLVGQWWRCTGSSVALPIYSLRSCRCPIALDISGVVHDAFNTFATKLVVDTGTGKGKGGLDTHGIPAGIRVRGGRRVDAGRETSARKVLSPLSDERVGHAACAEAEAVGEGGCDEVRSRCSVLSAAGAEVY